MDVRWYGGIAFLVLNFVLGMSYAHAQMSTQSCLKLFNEALEFTLIETIERNRSVYGEPAIEALSDVFQLQSPRLQGTGSLQKRFNPEDLLVKDSVRTNYKRPLEIREALAPIKFTLNPRYSHTYPVLRGASGSFQLSILHNLILKGDPALRPFAAAVGEPMSIVSVRGDFKPPYLVYFHIGKSSTGVITHNFMLFDNIDAASRYLAFYEFDMTELRRP